MTEPEPEPLELTCPRCGAEHEEYQEYCLECGSRIPGSYAFGRHVSGVWQRPPWLWAALIGLLALALVAGTIVAVAATGGDDERPFVGTGGTTGAADTSIFGLGDTGAGG